MLVAFASRAGSDDRPNEDFVAASPRVAIVLDGLSAPPELGTGCRHGTPWFVSRLGTELLSAAAAGPDRPLGEILARSIERVAALHSGTCDLRHPGTPQSTVAMLRERDDVVDHLVIFDSVVVLDGPSGLSVHSDRRVDAFARAEHLATRDHPIGSPEHQASVRDLVAAQRRHRNSAAGYWVAGADPQSGYEAVSGTRPRSDTRRAALMSDGASAQVEVYGLTDWTGLLAVLEADGPDELISRVRAAEATDPEGARWPRYKRSDDATVVWCRFAELSAPSRTGGRRRHRDRAGCSPSR
jgi:hypothetical protein